MQEGHNDPAAQHFALWQVAPFRLPVAHKEASGWWDAPPVLRELCPLDFLPPITASDFQVMRQAKMLALAQALQACTEASGAKTGILCEAARELQQCLGPFDDPQGGAILWRPPS